MKVMAWYDNEYGYSSKVLDLIEHMYRSIIRYRNTDSMTRAPEKGLFFYLEYRFRHYDGFYRQMFRISRAPCFTHHA